MAVRTSMAALILRVRSLIGDNGATQTFADQDIQDVLDDSRTIVRYALLRPAVTLENGQPVYNYTDYFADWGDWEANEVLQDGAYHTLTPAVSDELTGHWTFNLPEPGQLPPVFITGVYYDKYRASAELLERWAALLAGNYDFSDSGQSFKRSQPFEMKLTLAKKYWAKSRPVSIPMERDDLSDDSSMANITIGNTDVMGW